MGSTFSGFSISSSGLFAQQRALNVISHNISNANTEGYVRQRLDLKAFSPEMLPGGKGSLGRGVDMEAVKQFRDEFLDFKFRGESTKMGEWEARQDALMTVESIFNEPSDTGIRTVMDEFYSSLQELNKNPESLTTRALVRQRAIAFTGALNAMSESLKKYQVDVDFNVQVTATQINGYAQQIADLNKTIFAAEVSGGSANDLRDQRNLLVDKLSELIECNYYEDNMGRFYINVNGGSLVSHFKHDEIVFEKRDDELNPDDALNLSDPMWKSGNTFNVTGGKIKALIDMENNISGESKGIPYYINKLNEFSDTVVNELNRIHSTGFNLDGESGINMFTINGWTSAQFDNYMLTTGLDGGEPLDVTEVTIDGVSDLNTYEENSKIIARNIKRTLESNPDYQNKSIRYINGRYYLTDKVKSSELTIASDIDLNLDKIAASSSMDGLPGDGTNALYLASSRDNIELFDWGSPDDFVKSLVSNLGVDAQEATRMVTNQTALIEQVEISRQSISGVSLDEEMAEMIKFQHAYNANARMITAVDEMLDIIVNRLGIVGR
jgi:flagellar hook-associated protein 1 FlgK